MKINRLRLDPTSDQLYTLSLLGDRVSALWNAANYTCRQQFLAGERVPSYTALCSAFLTHPTYRALPSDIAQEGLKKLAEAWTSFRELRRRWQQGMLDAKPGLPRYRKRGDGTRPTDLIPIKCDRSYRVNGQTVEVTLPKDVSAQRLVVRYRGTQRYCGSGRRAEIWYDAGRDRWYLTYAVEVPLPPPRLWTRRAGIDLGVRILASVSIEGMAQAVHFRGRELLKDFRYWQRQIARHQQELSHRPKTQRTSKRLRRLYAMQRARLHHAWDAMAQQIVGLMHRHRVGIVAIGWPRGILHATTGTRRHHQMTHAFWSFAQVIERITLALERRGIAVERVGERGTSSTCCRCGSVRVRRAPRHRVTCQDCHLVIHSDQAGSRNIVRQKTPAMAWDGGETPLWPETHRWSGQQWVDVKHPPASSVGDRAA